MARIEALTMLAGFQAVQVQCYAGYRGEQEPRRFTLAGRELEVDEILDRWLDPAHRYFKVRVSDGSEHLLRHDEKTGQWQAKTLTS